MNILIPMAGLGDRFKQAGYKTIKPLIPIFNKPMIQWVVETLGLKGNFIFIVNSKNESYSELVQLLKSLIPNSIIVETDSLTDGPASSCLLAKKYIDTEVPLLITNCDQIMTWDVNKFKKYVETFDGDGFVVTYDSNTTKNSYIRVDSNGIGLELAEKKVISNLSLNGIHFWKKGKDFVYSAEKMISENKRVNGEFYIAPTYNELISMDKLIRNYHIDKSCHWPVGTPEDLDAYITSFGIKVVKGDTMKDGWFIGNFSPSVHTTEDFEICYKKHKKGEKWDTHYHKKAREINYLIKGSMKINDIELTTNDIFIIEPHYVSSPTFLTDCELIVVKTPSVVGDKYVVE